MIGKLIRNPNSNLQTGLKYILMTDLLPEILWGRRTRLEASCPISNKRIKSDQSLGLFGKIAAACEEPATNLDRGQKIGIFPYKPPP
jgi:hypothetical protein